MNWLRRLFGFPRPAVCEVACTPPRDASGIRPRVYRVMAGRPDQGPAGVIEQPGIPRLHDPYPWPKHAGAFVSELEVEADGPGVWKVTAHYDHAKG